MSQNKLYDLENNSLNKVSYAEGAEAAATLTGTGVDVSSVEGPVALNFGVGDIEGSPTSFTATCTVEESDDDSTYTALSQRNALVLDATDTAGFVHVQPSKKYVRSKIVLAFVGGSSPKATLFAVVNGQKRQVGGSSSAPTY